MRLCRRPSKVHGAQGCPREDGHDGPHYWWIPWQDEADRWHVDVYSGEPEERVKRCRGTFSDVPRPADVHRLLLALVPLKRRELARRTPHSAPQPAEKAINVDLRPGPGRFVVVADSGWEFVDG